MDEQCMILSADRCMISDRLSEILLPPSLSDSCFVDPPSLLLQPPRTDVELNPSPADPPPLKQIPLTRNPPPPTSRNQALPSPLALSDSYPHIVVDPPPFDGNPQPLAPLSHGLLQRSSLPSRNVSKKTNKPLCPLSNPLSVVTLPCLSQR
ncbi:hypothetical protein I3842_02G110300 [Carya illinoinensis]|uniref:Uncharacterized protein n=1 Tax=Carya illinoinensis TaxID=32201 RepID=A0A922FU98_CARIL|nr:hypothetical protein I3842_02G110300 [Carya illinoinensis]